MGPKKDIGVTKDAKEKRKFKKKMEKKLYDKQRYEKMKSDPESTRLLRIKEHEKYLKKKQKRRVKMVANMNRREKTATRAQWVKNSAAYRQRNKTANQEPSTSQRARFPDEHTLPEISGDTVTSTPPSGSSSAPGLSRQSAAAGSDFCEVVVKAEPQEYSLGPGEPSTSTLQTDFDIDTCEDESLGPGEPSTSTLQTEFDIVTCKNEIDDYLITEDDDPLADGAPDPVPVVNQLAPDDLAYFQSLASDLNKLSLDQKMIFRIKVGNILKELVAA